MSTIYVFLGGIWSKADENEIINNSKSNVQTAANVLQLALIKGLEKNIGKPIYIVNEYFLGSFPINYKKLFIGKRCFNHTSTQNHKDYNVEFVNLPIIKHLSRYINSKKYIKQLCLNNEVENVYVIGYSMSYSIVEGLLYAKAISPKVKTCLIIPDLPEYMNLGKKKSLIFSSLKHIVSSKLYKDIKKIDSFVTLTKYIYEALDTKKPYTVVEGIASDETIKTSRKETLTKNIVYTGTLDEKYGIIELTDAFTKIKDDNLRLIICGDGDGKDYLYRAKKRDKRIKYYGVVKNEVARAIQENAYLLINPRNSKEEYTKYSFPSKTMEYMVTGRPVLMYKLKGVPDEYDSYLYYITESIDVSLRRVLSIPEIELEKKGEDAREFVKQNKNNVVQAKKNLQMLKSI